MTALSRQVAFRAMLVIMLFLFVLGDVRRRRPERQPFINTTAFNPS